VVDSVSSTAIVALDATILVLRLRVAVTLTGVVGARSGEGGEGVLERFVSEESDASDIDLFRIFGWRVRR